MMHFCLETPQGILDDEELNIFEHYIPSGTYHTKICNALWQMYRYRALGSCRDRFIQRMVDRYNILQEKWESIFAWYESNKSTLTALNTAKTVTDEDTSASESSQSEDLPDTAVAGTYLSSRGSGSGSGSRDVTVTYTEGMTADLFDKMMNGKRDPYYVYVKEYESLFSEFGL